MPFDWREFLLLAHEHRNDPNEGVQRTCLSRTYYYVYHLGLDKARRINFTGKLPGLHIKLWQWCQAHNDRTIRLMGIDGQRMHSLRLDADYQDAPIANLSAKLKTQLQRARQFECLVAGSSGQQPPPDLS